VSAAGIIIAFGGGIAGGSSGQGQANSEPGVRLGPNSVACCRSLKKRQAYVLGCPAAGPSLRPCQLCSSDACSAAMAMIVGLATTVSPHGTTAAGGHHVSRPPPERVRADQRRAGHQRHLRGARRRGHPPHPLHLPRPPQRHPAQRGAGNRGHRRPSGAPRRGQVRTSELVWLGSAACCLRLRLQLRMRRGSACSPSGGFGAR
jgi:hypothetical protein